MRQPSPDQAPKTAACPAANISVVPVSAFFSPLLCGPATSPPEHLPVRISVSGRKLCSPNREPCCVMGSGRSPAGEKEFSRFRGSAMATRISRPRMGPSVAESRSVMFFRWKRGSSISAARSRPTPRTPRPTRPEAGSGSRRKTGNEPWPTSMRRSDSPLPMQRVIIFAPLSISKSKNLIRRSPGFPRPSASIRALLSPIATAAWRWMPSTFSTRAFSTRLSTI